MKLLVNKTVAHVVYYNERLFLEGFMFFGINVCYGIVTVERNSMVITKIQGLARMVGFEVIN